MNEWKARIKEKNPFVATENGVIVGYAELEANGHIDHFYTHHLWQGKGAGSLLYTAVEQEAVNRKIPELYAEVSLAAKDFFLKKGFEIIEERNKIICGVPAPNFVMKKELQ
jgi:putative acetyltransferase